MADLNLTEKRPSVSKESAKSGQDVQPVVELGERNISDAIDKSLEKSLRRKFDLILLPTLAIMYLFKYVHSRHKAVVALSDNRAAPWISQTWAM